MTPILLTVGGSCAYGMNTPESDLDIKGIFLSEEKELLGYLGGPSQFDAVEHIEPLKCHFNERVTKLAENGCEGVLYELRKFMSLASVGNPNILEILFCDEEDVILNSRWGKLLRENRKLFLSQVVRYSYAGYAVSQLKRIQSHRSHILNPMEEKPNRKSFGLTEDRVLPTHRRGEIEALIKKETDRGFTRDQAILFIKENQWVIELEDQNFFANLNAEYAYSKAMEKWVRYCDWLKNRNPERAALEAKMGFDGKHAAHLMRLLRTGKELMETGELLVRRPDAEELLSIRNGAWSYDKLIEEATTLKDELDGNKISSVLPVRTNREALNDLCVEIYQSYYGTI